MKRALALTLSILMLLCLFTGCGGGETAEAPAVEAQTEAAGEELDLVGFASVSMSESIYVLQEAALKEIFEGKAEVQTVSCDQDAATQIQQIKNFALMGADLIVINPTDVDALADAIKEAHDKGCKIYINGATSDSLSEEYYECCTVSDEYLCGAYIAMIAKNWIEAHADELSAANPDWELAFLESSLADETLKRTYGMESIVEPYLKDWEGNYVDANGVIVDEANKVENPAYSQIAADHFAGVKVEQDQMNGGLNVANILTTNPNTRVFLAYNSLASTQGGQYIVDNYADRLDEFAFFSGGVMGNEADYIVGSVSDEGVRSVMRGAVQFGVSAAGNDVADSVANTAYAILYGEEGVDYFKKNPDGIAAWWAVEEGWSPEGVASVAHFNILSGATVQPFDPIAALEDENTVFYWNSVDGFVEAATGAAAEGEASDEASAEAVVIVGGGAPVAAGEYFYIETTPFGEMKWVVTLNEDGTAVVAQPDNADMGNPTWTAVWTDNGDGTFTTGECQGDGPQIAAFWENNSILWLALNGNNAVPVKSEDLAADVEEFGVPMPEGMYTYSETNPFGMAIDWTLLLNDDGTYVLSEVNDFVGQMSYDGTAYTQDGDTVVCEAMTSGPAVFDWADPAGFTVTLNGDGTFTPVV